MKLESQAFRKSETPPGHGYSHHEVFGAMEGHVIEEAVLIGTYARPESGCVSPKDAREAAGKKALVETFPIVGVFPHA